MTCSHLESAEVPGGSPDDPGRKPDPTPPGKKRKAPVKEPPRRRGPHEVPDPPPVDDPRPPKPKRIVDFSTLCGLVPEAI